jgi:hypothetical protein
VATAHDYYPASYDVSSNILRKPVLKRQIEDKAVLHINTTKHKYKLISVNINMYGIT